MPHIPPEYLIGAITVFTAGFVQGCAAFAFALVSMPIMMLLFPPAVVVPSLAVVSLFNNAPMLIDSWRSLRREVVLPLLVGAIVGLPFGTALLKGVEPHSFKTAVGLVVVAVGVAMLMGWQSPVRSARAGMLATGVASGVLQGGAGIPGPPIVLFLANQEAAKDVFRASLAGFFSVLNIVSLVWFAASGLLTREALGIGIRLMPFAFIGILIGIRFSRRVPERGFRIASLALVIATGAMLVATNITDAFAIFAK